MFSIIMAEAEAAVSAIAASSTQSALLKERRAMVAVGAERAGRERERQRERGGARNAQGSKGVGVTLARSNAVRKRVAVVHWFAYALYVLCALRTRGRRALSALAQAKRTFGELRGGGGVRRANLELLRQQAPEARESKARIIFFTAIVIFHS